MENICARRVYENNELLALQASGAALALFLLAKAREGHLGSPSASTQVLDISSCQSRFSSALSHLCR